MMKNKFILCGILGWCMEIIFTGLGSLKNKEHSLTAHTSIWMFPIYGMACFLTPVCRILKGKNIFVRGLIRLDYAPYWFGAGLIFEKLLAFPRNTCKK